MKGWDDEDDDDDYKRQKEGPGNFCLKLHLLIYFIVINGGICMKETGHSILIRTYKKDHTIL